MKRVLLVGAGSMGKAILSGCIKNQIWNKDEIIIKGRNEESSRIIAEELEVDFSLDGHEAGQVDMVLIAVKPNVVESVLSMIAPYKPKRVLSVAAAIPISFLENLLMEGTEVIRVMPNTPCSIGEGMTAIAPGNTSSEAFIQQAQLIFSSLGKAVVVTEKQLDALGALAGAGPGYAFVIIDALADAGVMVGLPRDLAIIAAAQTLYGAAKMVLDTGAHPAILRDGVPSPGGTTIAGIHAMEQGGIRASLMDGVKACMAKSDEMSKIYER